MTWTAGALKVGRMSTEMPSIATVPSTTIRSIRTRTAWKLPSAARTSHMRGLGNVESGGGQQVPGKQAVCQHADRGVVWKSTENLEGGAKATTAGGARLSTGDKS